jgi:PAS domain-containing protein
MTQDLPDEMFRWIVEAMPEAVVYSDRDGTIRLWNRSAETIFGYRREEALGHTLDLIIPERWRARHWEGYLLGDADRCHPIRARSVGGSCQPERWYPHLHRVLHHPAHGPRWTRARSRGHRS